ncbi:hypothetical protein Tco_1428847 [Tanacetum coccineum]
MGMPSFMRSLIFLHEIIDFLTRSSIHHALTIVLGGKYGGQSLVSDQARKFQQLKQYQEAQESKPNCSNTTHRAWMKGVSFEAQIGRKEIIREIQWLHREFVSKIGAEVCQSQAKATPNIVSREKKRCVEFKLEKKFKQLCLLMKKWLGRSEDIEQTTNKESTKKSNDGLLEACRANGNFRAFSTILWTVFHIFDRQDLFHLYDLMREQYSEVTLDGFALILWGDLKIMMESSTEGNEQNDFQSG